jgi:putative tryptophan/tyrosine transport system substrate-binding protein
MPLSHIEFRKDGIVFLKPTFARRRFFAAAGALLIVGFAASAQTARSVRIGYLSSNPPSDTELALNAFRRRLRELGYVEGRNLVIEQRYAHGRFGDLPKLAAELVQQNLDVLFVYGTPASLAAKGATKAIPIVFGGVNDPLAVSLVTDLRKPGGNITGVTTNNSELNAKRLSLLKEAVPSASRVAVLANPDFKPTMAMLEQMQQASQSLSVELHVAQARRPDEISAAFARLASLRPDALVVMPDPWFLSQRARIVELANTLGIPAMYHLQQYLDVGGFMAYGASYSESFVQGAGLVDKILRGAEAADLPVEQPWRYEVCINLKAARALGLVVPQSLLLRADVILQ